MPSHVLQGFLRYARIIVALTALGSCGNGGETPASAPSEPAPVSLAQAGPSTQPASAGTRRALLIGVGEYLINRDDFDGQPNRKPGSKFPDDLRGAVNDVHLLRDVLIQRYEFQPENIVTLTDAEATREAILVEMKRIVQESGPEDVVHIHFSGHGSFAKDKSGEERDKFDETLLAYDARTNDVPDITDDEINRILAGLRTRAALVTFDSCHSGTATRGGRQSDIATRGGEPDPREDLYPDVAARGEGIGNTERVDASETILPEDARYVFMAGAAAVHKALDSSIDDEDTGDDGQAKVYGWFSWSLAQALLTLDQNQPASSVFFEVQSNMKSISQKKEHEPIPVPMLEATDADRLRPLLAGDDLAEGPAGMVGRTWVQADPLGDGKIVLRRGSLFGGTEESLWAIYPPGTTDFVATPQVGTAVVKSRSRGNSTADLRFRGSIEPQSRAVLISPSWSTYRVKIHLDNVSEEDGKAFRKAIAAQKNSADRFELVDAGSRARYVVDISRQTMRIHSTGRLRQVAAFSFTDIEAATDRAVKIFERPVRVADVLNMDNPRSGIKLDFSVMTPRENGSPRIRNVAGSGPLPGFRLWNEMQGTTDWNSMVMEVSADQDVYLTIVQIDPAGGFSILFPNPATPDPNGRIPGNKRFRIPDARPNEIQSVVYSIDMFPPVGRYELRAFAANDLETAVRIWDYIGEYGIALQVLEDDPLYQLANRLRAKELAGDGEDGLVSRGATEKPDWTAVTASYFLEE